MSNFQAQIQSETPCDSRRRREASAEMASNLKQKNLNIKVTNTTTSVQLLLCLVLIASCQLVALGQAADSPLTSRAAFLRAQRATSQRQPTTTNQTQAASTSSSTTSTTVKPKIKLEQATQQLAPATNRSTRTATATDIFENGQGFNIFVSTICDRESMKVTVDTSEPFYGIIHTRDQRAKSVCAVEGTGAKQYELQINQVLKKDDPEYCGVIKAARRSPDDKDLLQAVVVVRVHKNIERGDDKFFKINCTNQCRRDDCSSPDSRLAKLEREREGEEVTPISTNSIGNNNNKRTFNSLEGNDECNIYKFPWVITLLWCMGILLLAMIISHCIMCSSLVCRCVKTEVEDREPSVYEDGAGGRLDLSDDEDNLYNKKNHPMRIDYDNRDIYKTSNNYEPYDLCDHDQQEVQPKTRHSKSSRRR